MAVCYKIYESFLIDKDKKNKDFCIVAGISHALEEKMKEAKMS